MFPPRLCRSYGVRCFRATQRPGDIIVTYPAAYHAGFSLGPNMAEAMNFGTIDWLEHGFAHIRRGARRAAQRCSGVALPAACLSRFQPFVCTSHQRRESSETLAMAEAVSPRVRVRVRVQREGRCPRCLWTRSLGKPSAKPAGTRAGRR